MVITEEWLDSHRTDKGGWTRAQFTAIGIEWPPVRHWKLRVIGAEISTEDAARFEEGRFIRASGSKVHLQPRYDGLLAQEAEHMRGMATER